MIYHMSTKTFINDFITMVDTEDVLRYQYVVISSGVKADKSLENVMKMSMLMPPDRVCSDYMNSQNEEAFFTDYYEYLLSDKTYSVMCALMITESVETGDVIIMYGPNENKQIPYMNVIEDFFMNEFGYPLCDFAKLLHGKIEEPKFDEKKCLKRAKKVIEQSKEAALESGCSTPTQRWEYISGLGKKELRKLVKKVGFTYDGLSKSDMKDILYTMYDCRSPIEIEEE